MKHKFAITVAAAVVVVGIGSTVAWAATHGSFPGHMGNFSGHMGNGHMQQMGQGHMGQMDADDMQAMMARVHPGFDKATLDKLTEQCTKAMKDGTGSMHGSGNGQGMHSGSGGMMGGSGSGGMMGGSGSGGMMG